MNTAANVKVISAKPQTADGKPQFHQLRVAAYCRVSTDQEQQANSYQVQIEYYTDYINSNPEWTLAGIFADEGITGTSTEKRTAFKRMIRLCKQRRIDLILCKSQSRFSRNTLDSLKYIRMLKDLGIGVIFEKEHLNTLTEYSEFILTLHSSFAQAESESISRNVSLGVQMAFRLARLSERRGRQAGNHSAGGRDRPADLPVISGRAVCKGNRRTAEAEEHPEQERRTGMAA